MSLLSDHQEYLKRNRTKKTNCLKEVERIVGSGGAPSIAKLSSKYGVSRQTVTGWLKEGGYPGVRAIKQQIRGAS